MEQEGVIKYQCKRKDGRIDSSETSRLLILARDELRKAGLIGIDGSGVGFGNVSHREESQQTFLITGSGTSRMLYLDTSHIARVTGFNLEDNTLICEGPVDASSEAMTHAMIYRTNRSVNCIVHFHHRCFWETRFGHVPTTDRNAEYGSSQMARSVGSLCEANQVFPACIVMAGHRDGVVVYGLDVHSILAYIKISLQEICR